MSVFIYSLAVTANEKPCIRIMWICKGYARKNSNNKWFYYSSRELPPYPMNSQFRYLYLSNHLFADPNVFGPTVKPVFISKPKTDKTNDFVASRFSRAVSISDP